MIIGELKSDNKFLTRLKLDPASKGRGAITGKEDIGVWDFLKPVEAKGTKNFTNFPHMTISIRNMATEFTLTLPNSVKKEIYKRIFRQSYEEFFNLIRNTINNLHKVIEQDQNVKPFIRLLQRHYYPSQRSVPTHDAYLQFDIRTAFKTDKKSKEKFQPEWIEMAYKAMKNKKSNLQMQFGIEFLYSRSNTIKTSKCIDLIKEAMIAVEPIFNKALDRK